MSGDRKIVHSVKKKGGGGGGVRAELDQHPREQGSDRRDCGDGTMSSGTSPWDIFPEGIRVSCSFPSAHFWALLLCLTVLGVNHSSLK